MTWKEIQSFPFPVLKFINTFERNKTHLMVFSFKDFIYVYLVGRIFNGIGNELFSIEETNSRFKNKPDSSNGIFNEVICTGILRESITHSIILKGTAVKTA